MRYPRNSYRHHSLCILVFSALLVSNSQGSRQRLLTFRSRRGLWPLGRPASGPPLTYNVRPHHYRRAAFEEKKWENLSMVDPHIGLISYQQALLQRLIQPSRCKSHPDLTVLIDDVPDGKRLTYALMDGLKVKGTAVYVMNGKDGDRPYFQVGYAVAEDCRAQGIAQETLRASIAEISSGFKNLIPEFYIEAVVPASNKASLHIARKIIAGTPEDITDKESGEQSVRHTMLVSGK